MLPASLVASADAVLGFDFGMLAKNVTDISSQALSALEHLQFTNEGEVNVYAQVSRRGADGAHCRLLRHLSF